MTLSLIFFSGCLEEKPINEKSITVYVDDDYDNATAGWGIDHFNKIQEGIKNINESGTVIINNGIYFEKITIYKSINLIGKDKNNTIIISLNNSDVLEIVADNCVIQNISIKNSSLNAGIRIKSNKNTLTNNIISGNLYGLWIENQSENVISNNIISKNKDGITLRNSLNTILTDNKILTNLANGIVIDSAKNITITDNEFKNNGIKITGNLSDCGTHIIENNTANEKPIYYYKNKKGVTISNDAVQVILVNCSNFNINNINFQNMTIAIQIFYCSNISINSNYFESNVQNAIISYFSKCNTIINNIINSEKGIYLYSSNNSKITQNKIENTSTAIEILYSNYNDISNNNILFSTDHGLFIQYKSNYNTIIQNTIENTNTAVELYTSNNNDISKNTILNNKEYGLLIQTNSDHNIISNNKIINNQIGMRIKGSSKFNEVYKNEFNNNSKIGIYICCGTENSVIYNNSFIKNLEQVEYTTESENFFYKDGFGNYWDDYQEKYPNATQINGIWSIPYKIYDTVFEDKYPLVKSVII